VGQLDAKSVGYFCMYLHDQILFVESVAVSPAIQERGVGWARMNYVENVAIQKDVKIQLYTNTKMYKNIAMYQQLGYKVVDTRQEDGSRGWIQSIFFREIHRKVTAFNRRLRFF
jgi:ribosomal protein S18 acetylase RimI-like enzyme